MVQLLIRELAVVDRSPAEGDLAQWFRQRFGEEPTYSRLVERLGLTAAERQALIRRLLDDDGAHPRQPSPAHRSLARLVRGGWVRVIVTTNFDRLIEEALVAEGVYPTVLPTPESVAGALPLVHAGPVVLKLHGDQSDPTILNTDVELETYEPAVDRLLDQVFDEYGLIVCGWSAESDTALRRAIERSPTRRFTTFWSAFGDTNEPTENLIRLREAEVIAGLDADRFFGDLADSCEALASVTGPSALSVAASVALAKRELSGTETAISLHDRLRHEVERVRDLDILRPDARRSGDDQIAVVAEFAREAELLVALTATVAYWGTPQTDVWWTGELARLARPAQAGGTMAVLDRPRLPALAMATAAGVAAVASGRYDLLGELFGLELVPHGVRGDRAPAVLAVTPDVLHAGNPTSILYQLLRPAFADHLALGRDGFVQAWERWQYLIYLASLDVRIGGILVRPTSDGIRVDGFRNKPLPQDWILDDLERREDRHPLLDAGFFSGLADTMREAIITIGSNLAEAAQRADDAMVIRSDTTSGALPSGLHYPGSYSSDPDEVFGGN
jgi:hypothetical protein